MKVLFILLAICLLFVAGCGDDEIDCGELKTAQGRDNCCTEQIGQEAVYAEPLDECKKLIRLA